MQISYSSDGEDTGTMDLETLVSNFNENGGWMFGHNETDMRAELASRGWYEGIHEFGHYLALNLERLKLRPA